MNGKNFHYIVRAVIRQDKQILLVREIGSELTFLPGGHIEFAEPAKKALRRELLEETGIAARIGNFLGAVENSWIEQNEFHAEINLLFAADIPRTDRIRSQESHLEFLWAGVHELARYNLMPPPLITMPVLRSPLSAEVFWGSSLGEAAMLPR